MAKRELGIERVFDLGAYKSLRVKESVVVDEDNYSEEEVTGLRMLLLLRAYEVFAYNKVLMSTMAEMQRENGEALTGDQILAIVRELIADVENDMEVEKDASVE